jgi:hypothetical protein
MAYIFVSLNLLLVSVALSFRLCSGLEGVTATLILSIADGLSLSLDMVRVFVGYVKPAKGVDISESLIRNFA